MVSSLLAVFFQHNFDQRLQQLLTEEDYAGAILELKKCQKAAAKYKHFTCIAALTNKLQETLEFTDAQLERILAQVDFICIISF